MSCWRSYTCETLKHVETRWVERALTRMGITLNYENTLVLSRIEKRKETVDATFLLDSVPIDIGIKFDDGTGYATIVGDFWLTGLDEKGFMDTLAMHYQEERMLETLSIHGYTIDSIETLENGAREIIATSFFE